MAAQLGALSGQPVVITGSLIQRGRHSMIAVDEQGPWLRRDERAVPDPLLAWPEAVLLGDVDLSGEILTAASVAHGPSLLPLVADPVQLKGRVFRRGDLLLLDAPLSGIRRA